ncbi:hypothetical protein D3C83_194840 [compost metagenome]
MNVDPRDKLPLLALLRNDFGMSVRDARTTFDLLPGSFRTGLTRTEARVLASRIPQECGDVSIERE